MSISGPYEIHIQFVSAKGIPPGDHKKEGDSKKAIFMSDPFVAAFLTTAPDAAVYSTVEENNLTPTWSQTDEAANQKMIQGTSIQTDVVHFDLWDKDLKQFGPDGKPYKKCQICAKGELALAKLKPGKIITKVINLTTVYSKDRKNFPVDSPGGQLTVLIQLLNPGEVPWVKTREIDLVEGFVAKVKFIEAKGLPAADHHLFLRSDTSDPYVVAQIKGAPKDTAQKTPVANNTLNPKWDDERQFVFTEPEDILQIQIFDHDKKSSDECLSSCEIPVGSLKVGEQTDFVDFPLTLVYPKGKSAGTISLAVLVEEIGPDGIPDTKLCTFDWGACNSSYASSFEECDTAHGYHGFPPDEEDADPPELTHVHKVVADWSENKTEHIATTLSGTVQEVKLLNLPKFSVAVYGVKHGILKDKSPLKTGGVLVDGGAFQPLSFEFSPVAPGEWLGVVILDESGTKVCLAKTKIKALKLGESEATLVLEKAPLYAGEVPPAGFGTVKVALKFAKA